MKKSYPLWAGYLILLFLITPNYLVAENPKFLEIMEKSDIGTSIRFRHTKNKSTLTIRGKKEKFDIYPEIEFVKISKKGRVRYLANLVYSTNSLELYLKQYLREIVFEQLGPYSQMFWAYTPLDEWDTQIGIDGTLKLSEKYKFEIWQLIQNEIFYLTIGLSIDPEAEYNISNETISVNFNISCHIDSSKLGPQMLGQTDESFSKTTGEIGLPKYDISKNYWNPDNIQAEFGPSNVYALSIKLPSNTLKISKVKILANIFIDKEGFNNSFIYTSSDPIKGGKKIIVSCGTIDNPKKSNPYTSCTGNEKVANSHYIRPLNIKKNNKEQVLTEFNIIKDIVENFVEVPKGCFQMGESLKKIKGQSEHRVCLDKFWIGKYEVTQDQWEAIMGNNPSWFNKSGQGDYPVEHVSWSNVQDFIKVLNSKTGYSFRLPTEAEWEYAARSGGREELYAGGNLINDVAWYKGNSSKSTHRVGEKSPNYIGIYDMNGNVSEFCNDRYSLEYYKNSPLNNPDGPPNGKRRVVRGGSWGMDEEFCTSTYRSSCISSHRGFYIGFRLAHPTALKLNFIKKKFGIH